MRVASRSVLLLCGSAVALISPRVDLLFNFVGAVTTNMVQTMAPQVFFLLLHRRVERLVQPTPPPPSLLRWGMCVFAICWGLFSLGYGLVVGGGALVAELFV